MMLVLSGVPPDMPVAVLRNMIQQTCNVEYVLIEEQERDSPSEPRSVTVGCPGESAGQRILQCLNGMMLGPHRLYVAPFVPQGRPQSEFYADEDDAMTGLSNRVPPWKQPQEWSMQRSDENYRPSSDVSFATPGQDARPYGATGPPSMQPQDWSTRRSDVSYRPSSDEGCAAPGLDARPSYGAFGPLPLLNTLSKVPPWFQERPLSPVRERSPVRVWEKPMYARQEPSPDRQGRSSSFRGSEHYGPGVRDSYSGRHDRAGRVGANSHRDDADVGLSRKARKRAAEFEKRQTHLDSRSRDDRKAIPSLLQPLGSLPVPRRPVSPIPSRGIRGRAMGPGFRTEPRSDKKSGRRPDLARHPIDRQMVVANVRSAPQSATKSGQKMPHKNSQHPVMSKRNLMEDAEKTIIESMFNSRPQPGTGVKPKYKKFMEALKGEVRHRLLAVRGDARDPETLLHRYSSVYSQLGNRKSRRKSLLLSAVGKLSAKHSAGIADYVLMETPWVSPVELDTVPESQRKDLLLKRLLNQACDQVCKTWLKPPHVDVVRFAQELARLDSADTPGNASSGALSAEDKMVYDRFKLLTFRSLRKHVAATHDTLKIKPEEIAQKYMMELPEDKENHLSASVAFCKKLFPNYEGLYNKLVPQTWKDKPDLEHAISYVCWGIMKKNNLKTKPLYKNMRMQVEPRMEELMLEVGECDLETLLKHYLERYHDDAELAQIAAALGGKALAPPKKKGGIRVDSNSSLQPTSKNVERGKSQVQVNDREKAEQTEKKTLTTEEQAANAGNRQTLLRELFDEASQLISQECLKPSEMDVQQFTKELHHFNSQSTLNFSSDEVWTGQLSAADAAVYEYFKKLTFRRLLVLVRGGQLKLDQTPQQIAEVYRKKLPVTLEQHLKSAVMHCETLHGPYRGLLNVIRSPKKTNESQKQSTKTALITATANVCNKIMEDNNFTKKSSRYSGGLYIKLRNRVKSRMMAIQDLLADEVKNDVETLLKRYQEQHFDDQDLIKEIRAPAVEVDIDDIEIDMDDLEDF